MSLQPVIELQFFFRIHNILENIGHLFGKVSPNLGLSDVLS